MKCRRTHCAQLPSRKPKGYRMKIRAAVPALGESNVLNTRPRPFSSMFHNYIVYNLMKFPSDLFVPAPRHVRFRSHLSYTTKVASYGFLEPRSPRELKTYLFKLASRHTAAIKRVKFAGCSALEHFWSVSTACLIFLFLFLF